MMNEKEKKSMKTSEEITNVAVYRFSFGHDTYIEFCFTKEDYEQICNILNKGPQFIEINDTLINVDNVLCIRKVKDITDEMIHQQEAAHVRNTSD